MIAPYSWLVAGEIPSQRLRSYTFGFAAAAGFLGAWLITFTAPYFINPSALNWGPRYGYIWFPSCMISAAWVYFFLPEVKGRTLEEIDVMVSSNRTFALALTNSYFSIVQRKTCGEKVPYLPCAAACNWKNRWKVKYRVESSRG